jgi:hypothetical protein
VSFPYSSPLHHILLLLIQQVCHLNVQAFFTDVLAIFFECFYSSATTCYCHFFSITFITFMFRQSTLLYSGFPGFKGLNNSASAVDLPRSSIAN